MLLLHDKYQQ